MKINSKFLSAAFLSLLAVITVSCVSEEMSPSSEKEMTFKATFSPQTKTMPSGNGEVMWMPSDYVSIFSGAGEGGGSPFVSNNESPSEEVDFVGYLKMSQSKNFWAVYPYRETNSCDGKGVTASLSATQTAVAGSFPLNGFPAVAHSSTPSLSFYALAGGLQFTLKRDDITSVSIRGNAGETLAGTFRASFGSDGMPVITQIESGKQEVNLATVDGSAFIPGVSYYISLLPADLKNGVTITLQTSGGKQGVINSTKAQAIKRGIFGKLPELDESVSSWQDAENPSAGGGVRNGLYLGIVGFNQQLYKMNITRLDNTTKSKFDSFIDVLTAKNGTLLYHSVGESLQMLGDAVYPDDLSSVSLVNFTDGLDQGSVMMIENYPGDSEYLEILNKRLSSTTVLGQPLASWSVGLKGSDVGNEELFRSNLQKLAVPSSNAFEVKDMSAVNTRFQEIAGQLNKRLKTYSHDLTLTIPGQVNGTRMRFVLDGAASAESSQLYIEGTFNLSAKSLTDVSYHGCQAWNGSEVTGEADGIFIKFAFKNIVAEDSSRQIYRNDIRHWLYVSSTGAWQKNSEFDAANDAGLFVTTQNKSAVVLLNLDCSTSLSSQFSTLKSYAKSFVSTLYYAVNDQSEVSGISLNSTSLTLNYDKGESYNLKANFSPSTPANKTLVWASSNPDVAKVSSTGVVTAVGGGECFITATTMDGGFTAKCRVNVKYQLVTGVSMDKTSISLIEGNSGTLTATVTPSYAHDKSLTWTSSDENVATVDQNGKVTAKSEGTATITATANDGSGKYAECSMYVYKTPEVVDLGLSVKWASFNVGASSPEEYGVYYAWGETSPKSEYSWRTYKWCKGSKITLTKYCSSGKTDYWAGSGSPDNKSVLNSEDDVACVKLGGKWRTPTYEEWDELINKCTWTWKSNYNGTGVNGWLVAGPNGNSIFLPAAGYRSGTNLYYVGSDGSYWSSSLTTGGPGDAWLVDFYSANVYKNSRGRCGGQSVRPVTE